MFLLKGQEIDKVFILEKDNRKNSRLIEINIRRGHLNIISTFISQSLIKGLVYFHIHRLFDSRKDKDKDEDIIQKIKVNVLQVI